MKKFKNKYRTTSHRRPHWDYSANALYFLTINTQHRICNLGEIVDNEMVLSDFGHIVQTEWDTSFTIRKELILHEFVIMPNHLHAIVEIDNPDIVATHGRASQQYGRMVQQYGRASQQSEKPDDIPSIKRNPPIRLPKSISSFIAGFKSAVNTQIDNYIDDNDLNIPKYNRNNHFFQPNYHDHIIRNGREYFAIARYIQNNPANWNKDRLKK